MVGDIVRARSDSWPILCASRTAFARLGADCRDPGSESGWPRRKRATPSRPISIASLWPTWRPGRERRARGGQRAPDRRGPPDGPVNGKFSAAVPERGLFSTGPVDYRLNLSARPWTIRRCATDLTAWPASSCTCRHRSWPRPRGGRCAAVSGRDPDRRRRRFLDECRRR